MSAPRPVVVRLRPMDLDLCRMHADAWLDLNPDWRPLFATDPEKRRGHIARANMSELAVHRARGLTWECSLRPQTHTEPDVYPDWQVRETTVPTGHLLVWSSDNPMHRFVLCIIAEPDVLIAGYMRGRDAKRRCYWHTTTARYWVPQADLAAFPARSAVLAP